ncbi:MAG: response regulator [Archangium sp.]
MDAQRLVVVAEDDDDLREILTIALANDDRRVLPMEDGTELFDYLEFVVGRGVAGELPDVVVTDNDMPGATGVEVANWSRANGITCPFLIFTAFANEARRANVAGDTMVISKPQPLEVLQRQTEEALERAKRRIIEHLAQTKH